MKKRKYGNTGIEVSEIGFGAWQIGDETYRHQMTDSEAIRLVHEALDAGINLYDTAPTYGYGNSESLLGKALKGKRDQIIINTKFGNIPEGGKDFSPARLAQSVEESLTRLQTDMIDSVILHNPPKELFNGDNDVYDALEKLKAEGKIRAYGASLDYSDELFELSKTSKSQVAEVLFNAFHQEPALAFPMAHEKGLGLIIKVALDSGWLSGKYNADSIFTDIRSRWTQEQKNRRSKLVDQFREIVGSHCTLTEAAMAYVLTYKEVSSILPGFKTSNQIKACIKSADVTLTDSMIEQIKTLYEREISYDLLPW